VDSPNFFSIASEVSRMISIFTFCGLGALVREPTTATTVATINEAATPVITGRPKRSHIDLRSFGSELSPTCFSLSHAASIKERARSLGQDWFLGRTSDGARPSRRPNL
jgi:hypothetical protein